MLNSVDTAVESFSIIVDLIESAEDPSALVFLNSIAAKNTILIAASYFETVISQSIERMARSYSEPVGEFVRKQGIERRYHTMFDWDRSNVNRFLSLFGTEFSILCQERFDGNIETFKEAAAAFIWIGKTRNELVHQNFGAYFLQASSNDVIEKYQLAKKFVDAFQVAAQESSSMKPRQ